MKNNENIENEINNESNNNLNTTTNANILNNQNQDNKNFLSNLAKNNNYAIENNKLENNIMQKTQRKLYVDLQAGTEVVQPEKFCDNSVRTTQYTLITFLPFALLNQYKNPFNIYFLVSMIIDCIPSISSVNPTTTIMPVVIVMIINLIREAVEDYRKYSNDKSVNESLNYVYKLPKFLKQKCELINVGNIVRVKKNETIPADLLIIKTSLKSGFCYMQTSNLDGETALKPREAIHFTQQKIRYESPKTFKNIFNPNFYIEVDIPSANIYEIGGTIFYKNQKIYFDSKNILLKGSRLKSVDYAFGIAIYTGKDTKLMKNINRTKLKQSDIDRLLLYIIIFLIGLSIFVTIISSIIGVVNRNKGLPDYDDNDMNEAYIFYYRKGSSKENALEVIRIIAGHFHILTVIPISIMIVNAVIKVFQSAFLEFSPQYKEDPGDKIKCYSTTLIEQLGKVKYIFSDKTGTITKNELIFQGCSIYGKLFDNTISNNGTIKPQKIKSMPLPIGLRTALSLTQGGVSYSKGPKSGNEIANSYIGTATSFNTGYTGNETTNGKSKITPYFCFDYFYDCLFDKKTKINLDIKDDDKPTFMTQSEAMEQFLLNIVINHDVLVEKRTEKNDVIYQGISPDEVTLVSIANELGYTFLSRENEKIIIEIYDDEKNEKELSEYQVLKKFDFTSERQSSAIIVRDLKTNKILLYMKGSDRKIIEGIDSFSSKYVLPQTQEHVDKFAQKGLRTLCYCFKILEETEYSEWVKDYEEMKYLSIKDKSLCGELNKLIDKIESNTILLGATALEDKLQDRVKRDIEDFIEADINFWMITGDKLDTAETIGHSCGIISEDSEVFKIRENKDANQILEEMEKIKKSISKADKELENIISYHNKKLANINNNDISNNNTNLENIIFVKNAPEENEKNKNNNLPLCNNNFIINNQNLTGANNNTNDINIYQQNKIINNNTTDIDKKTESSIKNSESSINPSEVMIYLTQNENKNKNDDYLEEISNIQKNEELNIGKFDEKKENDDSLKKINIQNSSKENNKNSLFKKTQNESEVNRKQYMKAYDYFQNKLNEYSKKTKNRCFLFKLKYIYPQPDKIYIKNEKVACKYTLIIEGSAIDICIENEKINKLFYELIKNSRSLICCRSSPSQKSKIVKFIKSNSDDLTLAIGDGGNDVNMIKTAHVGIGIFGKEGYQAAYNSDYAISQFKYLKRLLFVDGRFSLARNSYFIYHYFYKNVIYSYTQLWFQIFSLFSGRSLFDDWYATSFNSFFTVVPIAVRAAVEEDFDADFIKYPKAKKIKLTYLFPDIYKEFRESKPFNIIKFVFIYMLAFIISIIYYIIPAYSFYKGSYGMRGIVYSFWDVSWESIFCIIITHFAMVFQDTFLYVKFTLFWYLLQIITDIVVLVIINQVNTETGIDDTLWFLMGNLNFWFTLILICGIIFIPFYILRNAEYFFGGFIVNLILQNRIDHIYSIKYCQKKVDEMTRRNRKIAKFMKIYKNREEQEKINNYADKQMLELVNQFKTQRRVNKKYKKKKNTQNINANINDNINAN